MAHAIRRLKETDAAAVFRVLEAARASSVVSIGPKWSYDQLALECRESGLVTVLNGEVKAFILWRDTGAAFEISFLATAPNAQGQGLMSALLDDLKRHLPPDRQIWLEVHEQNQAARALYESAGFKRTGQRAGYYADGATAILYNYG